MAFRKRGVAQPGSALQWGGRHERAVIRNRERHDTVDANTDKAPDLPEVEPQGEI
jgi:hypothetical protein